MRRTWPLLLAACLAALACEQDPARSVKIIARPAAAAQNAATSGAASPAADTTAVRSPETPVPAPAAGAVSPPRAAAAPPKESARPAQKNAEAKAEKPSAAAPWPPGCPPPPETSSGPSSFTASGPCAFEHRTEVACEALEDDFLVTLTRKAAGGGTLMVFINVEFYKGPGDYKDAQIFLGLQDKTNMYRWSTDTMNATVGKGEEFITMPETRLKWEPAYLNCTGPMLNFQCEGRGAMSDLPNTTEIVSGTLRCQMRPLQTPRK